jgi:predicted metal-binding membrane protein
MPVAVGTRLPRGLLVPVLFGIVSLAWVALWWLERSPYGWLFHRHGSADHGQHGQTTVWLYGGAFLIGWLLMTTAMMLPTTLPLVRHFRRLVIQQAHASLLISLLLAGYLSAWLVFGVIALAFLWSVDQIVLADAVLSGAWIWGAGLFFLAGAFQLSPLKYDCLDKCRTPLGFLISHWHGRNRVTESFNVGWSHGLFCVGCCWALMLLMFAVGTASLGWMLLLALLMAVEKNAPWGRRMARPLGFLLLGVGVGIATYNLAT